MISELTIGYKLPLLFFGGQKLLSDLKVCSWYRDLGMKGLFTGVGPRVARAGPSVGIVVSFYEVVKYVLQNTYNA